MKKLFLLIATLFFSFTVSADKLPKKVEKSRNSVASILTYKNGVLKDNGTAVFVGNNGELLVPYSLLLGADSAVVIDIKGRTRPVLSVVGVNDVYDYAKVRVLWDKKISSLSVSNSETEIGRELYILSYGKSKESVIDDVRIAAIDSFYSHAYYTLDKPTPESSRTLPLVNEFGELVAMMQPTATTDTLNSYAVGATIFDELVVTPALFGKGYYKGISIRTALPSNKEDALSCMYMQAVIGDSASYGRVADDFIKNYPDSYEGYLCRAEYMAIYCMDIGNAEREWAKSLALADKPAEVYFNKAKVVYSIMQNGDTVSNQLSDIDKVIELLDSAIMLDNQPLYLNYKADILLENSKFAGAYDCYIALTGTNLRSADIFARASQCQGALKKYDVAVELMDSAINCLDENAIKAASPYILTRALLKYSAGRYRDAVLDYNMYEKIASPVTNSNFYYLRSQAEVEGKMYQQALNDLEVAISIEPENVAFYLEKGLLCYRVNMLEDSAETLEKAKEIASDVPDVYYLLGCVYHKTGNKKLAEENLLQAVSMGHDAAVKKLEELKE